MRWHTALALLLALPAGVSSTTTVPPSKWDYPYPWPVHYHNLTSQTQHLSMAYMDVPPTTTAPTTNTTTVLLHGKNFCGATWAATARTLAARGHRVLIPDQLGFCKSSKPDAYQFSLHQLALNTHTLLSSLNITHATVLGHSMGGMLATRLALLYPTLVTRLVLTNPLGLEDWLAQGVPYRAVDALLGAELASNYSSIRAYQQETYYVGTWAAAYDEWVEMLASLYALPGEGATFAFDMALVTEMVLTQPVAYEFARLAMPTLLLVGTEDTTAIGKQWAPPEVRARLGRYDVLGRETAARIPRADLVEFAGLGHAPQVQDPEAYHAALLGWLEA